MSPRKIAACAVALLTLAASSTPASSITTAQAAPAPQPSQRWVVRYDSHKAMSAQSVKAASQGGSRLQRRFTRIFPGEVVQMSATRAAAVRAMPGVASVEPDRKVSMWGVQGNPPAGLDRVDQRTPRATRSYTSHYTGQGVKVYVVDTGLNLSHRDFSGRISPGPNFVNPGSAPSDCQGHGTHVAGIAAGSQYGVAKRATVVPIKVLDCQGDGYSSDTMAAMEWIVADHVSGPAVVNLSLGGDPSAQVDAAVAALIKDGVTVVTAAGNQQESGQSMDACRYSPSRVPGAVTVANATGDNRRYATSFYGKCVDLYAPGTGIRSAWKGASNASNLMTGTSMASPHVAGAAALVLQARPSWSAAQVAAELNGKATRNVILGAGAGTPNRLLYTLGGSTPGVIERVGTPSVAGTAKVGQTLTARTGTWGNGAMSFKRQWYRVNRSGTTTAIPGATATTYRPTAADKGQRLQLRVTAAKTDYRAVTVSSALTAAVG